MGQFGDGEQFGDGALFNRTQADGSLVLTK